ncbi:sulfur oxidation c-type cytochrome SoxA [Neptuniibacter pectenicola]|jgi:sulfur-oxidizing protein SoxA|uniref:sulfur oxidation c-type cytochrome SoxA n=1 Tax=Neptuniibacter pectenicola TaxID=1806669 RepID=UPI0007972CDF|nr:sulfur oxidation c-type cytochrome SoxA [Neptuniibacter pectenicola]KXJ50289.1 MAG: sulfur oxidation c-type cytochrome SoxA [Neptuniibacter sp. Phe_28]|tara:strand:- start:8537 stop:9403 length:867 start_codon:yes stop_codon:yes gene_type:complete
MKIIRKLALGFAVAAATHITYAADTGFDMQTVDPEADRIALQNYYKSRFPNTEFADYVNGIYSVDADSREQWVELEEFPPYEFDVEKGEELFNTAFANGKGYADCFENGGIGIRHKYPYWNKEEGTVKTLEQEINECRVKNGEEAFKWGKGPIAQVSAYMAWTSRDKVFDIQIPADDPRAKAAYLEGKKFFYSKRGQLNLSCANCHLQGSNIRIRADLPSPQLGHVTHFPVFRSKWGELGTLHRRYSGCHKDSRSNPLKPQAEEFRNLEYFQSYMSNGLVANGPGARK